MKSPQPTRVPHPEERPFLSPDEAAHLLGVSASSVRRWARLDEIPHLRRVGRILIPTIEVRRLAGLPDVPESNMGNEALGSERA